MATPRRRRGCSVERPARDATAATWLFRGETGARRRYANATRVQHAALSGSPRRGCDYFAHAIRDKDALRDDLGRLGVPACAVVDDMFAVVPRSRAAAYFGLEADFPRRPDPRAFFPTTPPDAAERAAFGSTASPDDVVRACRLFGAASRLRVGIELEFSRTNRWIACRSGGAVGGGSRRRRGHDADIPRAGRPCAGPERRRISPKCRRGAQDCSARRTDWTALFDCRRAGRGSASSTARSTASARPGGDFAAYFKRTAPPCQRCKIQENSYGRDRVGGARRYGVGSHDFRHGCCEGRLTWRLLGRRVPTAIRPFPFVFVGRGSGRGDPLRRMERSVVC